MNDSKNTAQALRRDDPDRQWASKENNIIITIAQFQYFKSQRKTIDITTRLRGVNPTNSTVYSPEPRAEVYCLTLNFKISKLGY